MGYIKTVHTNIPQSTPGTQAEHSCVPVGAGFAMLVTLIILICRILPSTSDVTIDLSKAMLDEETGNYCVVQKVR